MHGCSSGSALLVNAEVDSMGGVVDGGDGIGLKTSLHRAAIEKAQAELRQEYDVLEERRRELEFLEKGGNPLDFIFGNAASVSVQSTSLTDQNPEHFVTSEPKGSSALAASPHGDSVESIGKLGAPTACEPNSADNLTLFDGDNSLPEGERKSLRFTRRNSIAPSEQSSQVDATHNAKETEDSAVVRPYARRNRSRSSREGTRSNSFDNAQTCGVQGSSLPIRVGPRDSKGMKYEANNEKDMHISSVSNVKSTISNGDMILKAASDKQVDMDLNGAQELEMKAEPTNGTLPEIQLDVVAPKRSLHNKQRQLDPMQVPINTVSAYTDVIEKERLVSGSQEYQPCATTTNTENEITSFQINRFNDLKRMKKSIINEAQNSSAAVGLKGLDSESSCTQTSLRLDVHNDSDMGPVTRNIDSNENTREHTLEVEGMPEPGGDQIVQEKIDKLIDDAGDINESHSPNCQNPVKGEEAINPNRFELLNEVNPHFNPEGLQQSDHTLSETGRKTDAVDDNSSNKKENICTNKLQDPQDISMGEFYEAVLSAKDLIEVPHPQSASGTGVKVVDKAHEDSILEEARTIEVKRKRIAELSVRTLPLENRWKSRWDLVLEEMAWMANDFAQERLWKIAAASQICKRVAFGSRLRFEQQYWGHKLREKAHVMAKAVIQFWHSAELNLNDGVPKACPEKCEYAVVSSTGVDKSDVSKHNSDRSNMEPGQELESQYPRKNLAVAVQDYAMRYLKYNSSLSHPLRAEAPATPDSIYDFGISENSRDNNLTDLTEETLFYIVPSSAMEVYRKSIETHVMQSEKTGSGVQEEVEQYDSIAEYGLSENAYIEDEGETSAYYLNGVYEASKSSKSTHKKRKNLMMKSYNPRSYEAGADLPYGHCNTATQQAMLMGKRPASLNAGLIPTKRMRTASRQRVLSPFSASATGSVQVQMKTDASSGDSSFQDDQSTLHGGSQFQKSVEVESVGDFDKQLPYESAETSMKPKKKKKAKHPGSTYDQGWQLDSAMLNEQRENSKKRLESHYFESNGTSGLYSQHGGKKPKILKQPFENTFDNMNTVTGSIPSPVVSQNNMPNTNKILKLFGGRDRGRKPKLSKNHVGQPGSGNPWSLLEDQALVVLVHDMGPNWELISDAINSTLHFKCIFRKPNECKERHKILINKSSGDGGDSAEDSGSSQPYPSTLPGIPKGSARQLFQRLQEPVEEDTLKSHFEKIIKIGQKQHYRRSQNENQDPKQIVPIHNSHIIVLSQVCPNNLTGGVLTPLDLCDATTSNPDGLGYQDSHASSLAMSNQGSVASFLPSSGANSSLQGSSSMVIGANLSSLSAAHNATLRDVRYSVPRTSSALGDEQQRMQHYHQMLSSRGIQQSTLSVPSGVPGTDRGVRVLPGGSGLGMMCGTNRNMPISRPGFQGMALSPMLNSGSMLSSSMAGMANPVNMHSGAGSSQGNPMIRPREALHMMRPGHNPEHQRQIMVPELQMQVTQGNNQGITPFNGMSAAFSSQTIPPTIQSYPGHSQQQHQVSPQQSHALGSPHHPHIQGPNQTSSSKQQVYAIHLAKERQLQQQQQQFAVSNAMMSHVQPQPHVPMSSTLQTSSQIQPQTSSQPVSLSPLTPSAMTPLPAQHQQKHHLRPQGLNRNTGLTNQMAKQQQRQPQQQQFQQASRHHPQQRQHAQPQQQAKLMKGVGRGLVHQNLPMDHSHLNGLSVPPGSQALENGEQIMPLMQSQGLYSGSGLNQVYPSKSSIPQSPNHSQLQQMLHTSPVPSKQQQFPCTDNSTQGKVPTALSNHMLSTTHQAAPTTIMASTHQQVQQHSQLYQKQANQTQPSAQRMLQQNRQVNSELPNRPQSDVAQSNQHPLSTSQVGVSMAMPPSSIDSGDVLSVSPAVAAEWNSSEPAYDSSAPNSIIQSSSVGSPPLTNLAGSEPLPPISQGLGPRQLSGNLSSRGHSVGTQWQKQQLPPQQSLTLPSQTQQCPQQEQQPDKSPQHHLKQQQ